MMLTRAARKHSMDDSNAIAEGKSTESGGIWRRAVSSVVTFGDNSWTENASQRFDMRQQELIEPHHDE